jgi:hypothetical protein
MPHMQVHRSGGIVFVPTKEERELRQLKDSLKQEIEDVRNLKQELLQMKNDLQGGVNNANS